MAVFGPNPVRQVLGNGGDVAAALFTAEAIIVQLSKFTIPTHQSPAILSPERFLATMVALVLATTPVNMHEEARQRRASAS